MATIESIAAEIIMVGVNRGFQVIPEFCITAHNVQYKKKIDLAWVKVLSKKDRARPGSLACWKLISVFEIEGCDVAHARIREHSQQITDIRNSVSERFECYVVLYNEANHRKDPNWKRSDHARLASDRQNIAEESGAIIVKDGSQLGWLYQVNINARD